MNKKQFLFFGASFYQLPAIKRLEEREDIDLYILSGVEDDPHLKTAKNPVLVDITNPDLVEKEILQRGIKPDACLTVCTDWPLRAIGRLNDQYNLLGVSEEVALSCSDKVEMKLKFKDKKVPSAGFEIINSYADFELNKEKINYPSYFKAPKGSGSRGIIKVDNSSELEKIKEVFTVANGGPILVEEPLVGIEFGAQLIVQNKKIVSCFLHNDTVTAPPIQVPIGHSVPFLSDHQNIAKISEEALQKAIDALEIKDAICNCDLIYNEEKNEVKIIEISPRVGATGLSEIIMSSFEVDLYDSAIKLVLGEELKLGAVKCNKSSSILTIRSNENGVFKDIEKLNSEVESVLKVQPGDQVNAFRNGPDILGMLLLSREDKKPEELDNKLEEVHSNLKIILE